MTEQVRKWWSTGSRQDLTNDVVIAALFLIIMAGAVRLIG